MMSDQHSLFIELKYRFPRLPDGIIKDHALKYSLDHNKCIRLLEEIQERIAHFDQFPPDLIGHGTNQNQPAPNLEGSMHRRTSYPVYVNGNPGPSTDSQHSAPATGSQFMFENPPIVNRILSEQQRQNKQFRVPSSHLNAQGNMFRHPSVSSVPFGQPPVRSTSPYPLSRDAPVTHQKQHPLNLTFQDQGFENAHTTRYPDQQQHISPGEAPFRSSQFNIYSKPSASPQFSNQPSHRNQISSINIQLPPRPNQELTRQIYVQTTIAHTSQHHTPTTRYQEPTLFVPTSSSSAGDPINVSPRPTPSNIAVTVQKQEEDELAYRQALMVHQRARLDLLKKEFVDRKELLQQMKLDLQDQEQRMFQRMGQNSNQVITAEQNSKLCEEIRKLRVDCHCLSAEVDLQNSNQVLLGVTDENFYRHIFTGQAGAVGNVVTSDALVAATSAAMAVGVPPQASSEPIFRPPELKRVEEAEGCKWRCSQCTFENHPSLSVCEMCEIARVPPASSLNCTRSPASTYTGQQPCYCHAQH